MNLQHTPATGEALKNEGARKTETTTTHCGRFPRVAYTPSEFAALFGRHSSWGYRRIYAGDVKVINPSGSMLIPASEVDRLVGAADIYEGGDQ
jgi:hypothetical protein